MSVKYIFENYWDNLTISYYNTDIIYEEKGTLSIDNKG